MTTQTYPLFSIGHPLLDIQVTNGEKLLAKYGLNANDAILAGERHMPIYEEIARDPSVTYVAGGSSNAPRGAAYCLPPNSVVFVGCVGDDKLAEQLAAASRREGLAEAYLVKNDEKTGACAVILTGHHRSLVTTLRAAKMFDPAHMKGPEIAPLVDGAHFFYVEGYFLTSGAAIALDLAKHASNANKTFALNISAAYIAQSFGAQLHAVLPYVDIVICNESEAEAWASATDLPPTSLASIARALAVLPKANATRPRLVVITRGKDDTLVVSGAEPDAPALYPVLAVRDADIVDTNGAGDAFAGAFMAALVAGKDVPAAVRAGQKLAAICVQEVGAQYKWPKVEILE